MAKKRKVNQYRLIFVCLTLSILSWFAVKLSKNYTQTYHFHVEFINLPKGKFLTNQSDTIITVTVNAKGISLLQFEFGKDVPIDYSLIVAVESHQNHVEIKKKQLESYLINKLDFPDNSTITEPSSIKLELAASTDKQDSDIKIL